MMPPGFNLLRFKFPTVLAVGILVVIYSFQQGHWLSGPLLNMYYYGSSFPRTTDLQNEFSWADLPPSKGLVWHECYSERQCARLMVPLDHSKPEEEESAVIALVRKRSAYSEGSGSYRGPILFNPGGPGGSGVDMIMGPRGDFLSTIVGPQFDVVGFDPRGIARSTPRISFFQTDVERVFWESTGSSLVVNHSYEGISRTLARAKIIGTLATDTDKGYLRHMNTDQTARDMLSIVEAHGWSKLQYWGFSYGTILGATFASMFPDRIERMIIDGVADSEDYYAACKSLTSLIDTDKALDGFFSGCAKAGPDNCGFWAPTANDIRRNLTELFQNIRSRPLPIKSGSTYGILDYERLKVSIFTSLFIPYVTFPKLAKALGELAAGNGTPFYNLFPDPQVECSCDPSEHMFDPVDDATTAIVCNDGEVIPDDHKAAEDYVAHAEKISQWSDLRTRLRLDCIGWPKFSKTQFRGQAAFLLISVSEPKIHIIPGPFEGKTSHPILLIGNTADPATPLWAARNMSRGFEGSVVLQQNSVGHGSISAPSLCTQRYVRKYFQEGSLPPVGTICEVDSQPFPGSDSKSVPEGTSQSILDGAVSTEDHSILAAVQELSKIRVVTPPLF